MLSRFKLANLNVYIENMIYLIAFLLPFAVVIGTPLIYLLVAMAVIDKFINKRPWPDLGVHAKIFLIWMLLALLSLSQSPKIFESFYNYRVLFAQYAGLYFVGFFYINNTDKLRRLIYAVLAASIFVAAYGIYQYIEGVNALTTANKWVDFAEFPKLKTRVFSTLSNPNLLATFLLTAICLATGALLDRPQQKNLKYFLYLVLTVNLACLLLTFSRGAWLTLIVVMGMLGVLINIRILYVLLGVLIISFLTMHDILVARIVSIFSQTDTSAALRWAYWDSTIQMIDWNPVLGIGWSAYQYVYPEYDYFINNPDIVIYHAHNMYLNMLAEIGIVGGIVYISLFIYALYCLYKYYRSATRDKGCIVSILATIFVMLLMGITDYPLFNIQLSCVFWLLIGAAFGALSMLKFK